MRLKLRDHNQKAKQMQNAYEQQIDTYQKKL